LAASELARECEVDQPLRGTYHVCGAVAEAVGVDSFRNEIDNDTARAADSDQADNATTAMMRELMRLPAGSCVAVAMSGGVDSSTVAALLVEAGYRVFGLTARLYDLDPAQIGRVGSCCAPDDARDAKAVAGVLDIAHYTVDERDSFARDVIAPFEQAWQRGDTPNPCVACNRSLKFDRLVQTAQALGAQAMATGHYARLELDDGRPTLRRGVDPNKDQAYFLYPLAREASEFVRFPLGGMAKPEVRAHALRLGVPTAAKAESMDICFVGAERTQAWLDKRTAPVRGAIIDTQGRVLAEHTGLAGFTVGQRHGLGLGSRPDGSAWYVIDKRGDGTIVVGEHAQLVVQHMELGECIWLGDAVPPAGEPVQVQIRHRGQAVAARVIRADATSAAIEVHGDLLAAARGQSAVLFDGDRVLGGGLITRADQREPR
jgi:tRNA-specific 2-thiouridylase